LGERVKGIRKTYKSGRGCQTIAFGQARPFGLARKTPGPMSVQGETAADVSPKRGGRSCGKKSTGG